MAIHRGEVLVQASKGLDGVFVQFMLTRTRSRDARQGIWAFEQGNIVEGLQGENIDGTLVGLCRMMSSE